MHDVLVYSTRKANGENAQIAWLPMFKAWLICSKNISLVARTRKDLADECYKDQRYQFAKLIGEEWFNIVMQLRKASKLDQFISDIQNKTLVGEYCSMTQQHISRYEQTQIIFYAIVDNDFDHSTAHPDWSFDVFKTYGLAHVSKQLIGAYSDADSMNEAISKEYVRVAKASL